MPLNLAAALCCISVITLSAIVGADDPYRFFNWNVTYGDIYPLGVRQRGILINGQFPGPDIHSVTNDNLIINVFNSLDEPFLLSWNGIQQRRNSFEDGVYGTTCPIPPGKNFTYILQVKDQIGSFYYFPSLAFHKAAGGFGGIRILSRPRIPVPFPDPAGDYTVLIGDWYKSNHTALKAILDRGKKLHFADGILINGRGPNGVSFNVEQGKTYRLRISNVGLQNSLNFRIQGHKMTLVEVEGTHTLQTTYSSLDVHLGQSYSVLVTADQPAQDYYVVVSTRFTNPVLTTTGVLRYSNSAGPVSGPPPGGPTIQVDWSLNQARSIRTNLTASGPRPNPQGSYHYGMINTTKTIRLSNSAGLINGKQRYAVNSVSFVPADTPLKLADYFQIGGVFRVGSISDYPTGGGMYLDTAVLGADYRAYVEIVFENTENIIQSWHLNGYSFFVVGMDGGLWSSASRDQYNLRDGVARCTVQVYPSSWTAIYVPLDNVDLETDFMADDASSVIDPQLVLSHNFPETTYTYTERDAAIYALGIGACARDALDGKELKYVYHQDGQQSIQVLPTFAALLSFGSLSELSNLPGLQSKIKQVSLACMTKVFLDLFGDAYYLYCSFGVGVTFVCFRPLSCAGKATILEVEVKSYDKQSGEPLCMNRMTIYLRGIGGFSKSSHPYSYSKNPASQNALLYRLSGDYNPLHSDPMVAEIAGFSRPILHGLCTLGFAVRAIIRCVCKGDPNMIKIISGRFLLHVYPGETLITEMWLEGLRLFSPLFFVFVGCIPSKGEGAKQGSAFRVRRNQSFNFIPVKCFYLANE
ncbi:hypothetical protein RHGRI_015811 [Rhododendron griersonianum]|uniref:Uncharacterized protein n=1 Tax=Rhododendron griersonianum TaxID=479676 RepID=A0AAV6JNM1_9ERIC|nr:hypothetical protein RHGRI_015811 [Rhododendron griersonianum]